MGSTAVAGYARLVLECLVRRGSATEAEIYFHARVPLLAARDSLDSLRRRGLARRREDGRWVSVSAAHAEADAGAGIRRSVAPGSGPYLPSREEIAAACAAIRSEWTPAEEMARRGVALAWFGGGRKGKAVRGPARNPIPLPGCAARRNGRPMARRCPA